MKITRIDHIGLAVKTIKDAGKFYVDLLGLSIEEIEKVEEQRKHVPLTCIEWFTHNDSWAEKGSGSNATVIGWSPD